MALNQTTLSLGAMLFLQQPPLSTGVVMLPAHLMHARLDFHGSVGSLRTELRYMTDEAVSSQRFSPWQQDQPIVVTTPTTLYGVSRRRDGVVVTGPGTLTVTAGVDLDGDLRSTLVASGLVQIRLSFGVAGVERRVNIDAQLDYAPKDKDERAVEWRFDVPNEDPWAEAAVSP